MKSFSENSEVPISDFVVGGEKIMRAALEGVIDKTDYFMDRINSLHAEMAVATAERDDAAFERCRAELAQLISDFDEYRQSLESSRE